MLFPGEDAEANVQHGTRTRQLRTTDSAGWNTCKTWKIFNAASKRSRANTKRPSCLASRPRYRRVSVQALRSISWPEQRRVPCARVCQQRLGPKKLVLGSVALSIAGLEFQDHVRGAERANEQVHAVQGCFLKLWLASSYLQG